MVCMLVEGFKWVGCDLSCDKLVVLLESMNGVDFGGYCVNYLVNGCMGFCFVELIVIGFGGKILKQFQILGVFCLEDVVVNMLKWFFFRVVLLFGVRYLGVLLCCFLCVVIQGNVGSF